MIESINVPPFYSRKPVFIHKVEVFKTNVTCPHQAGLLVEQIHKYFDGYEANFDLDDCDNILRVKCNEGPVRADYLVRFLQESGFKAEVLPD